MRWVMLSVLIVSLILIIYIWVTRKLGTAWLTRFGLHITLAALGLYIVNFSGLVTNLYIPLNPVTISTVAVLGLPGVGLLLGLKFTGV